MMETFCLNLVRMIFLHDVSPLGMSGLVWNWLPNITNWNLNVGHPDFLIERRQVCFIGNITEQTFYYSMQNIVSKNTLPLEFELEFSIEIEIHIWLTEKEPKIIFVEYLQLKCRDIFQKITLLMTIICSQMHKSKSFLSIILRVVVKVNNQLPEWLLGPWW